MFKAIALVAALATPASAGSLSFRFEARTPDEARAVRTGLVLYALAEHLDSGADISQFGHGNRAGLRQAGRGQIGIIRQEGEDHEASLTQTGRGNAFGLFQFGRGAEAAVTQEGTGGAGLLIQHGW